MSAYGSTELVQADLIMAKSSCVPAPYTPSRTCLVLIGESGKEVAVREAQQVAVEYD